jgi:hypothetical protein
MFSATSALFYIDSVNIVTMSNILSLDNKNLTIMNINNVNTVEIENFTCRGKPF